MAPMPMIIPQQQQASNPLTSTNNLADTASTSDILLNQTIEPETTLTTNNASPIQQLNPAFETLSSMTNEQTLTNQAASNVPTNIQHNNMPLSSTMTDGTTTAGAPSNSYSIDLFDTPTPQNQGGNTGFEFPQSTTQTKTNENLENQTTTENLDKTMSMQQLLQQQYNQYYQNYQQHQIAMQNIKKLSNDTLNTSKDNANTSTFNSSILSGDDVSTIAESADDYRPPPPTAAASHSTTNTTNANVPISHLLAGNEYPSLHKTPPTAIVQSFTPVYVQTQQQQPAGNDIYQEYVQNPYNLTLQQGNISSMPTPLVTVEQHQQNLRQLQMQYQQQQQQQQQTQVLQATTSSSTTTSAPLQSHNFTEAFNSPANYFSSTVDPNTIPPGSEMLFGQP